MSDAFVVCADSTTFLRDLAPDSFEAVVTDPPYGLSCEPNMADVLRHWLAGDDYEHRGGGFMGKSWDSFVPGPSTWREVYRVLKPGGHALVFAGTRTHGLMEIALRLAGFEIRDCFESDGWSFDALGWRYGNGFPKSLDIGKVLDKAAGAERDMIGQKAVTLDVTAPAPEAARRWSGWGTALKPAHEPIIVARKPLAGTVAANVLRYGTGGMNIAGCRVAAGQSLGRWPPNVLLVHHPGCQQVGTRKVRGSRIEKSCTSDRMVSGYGGKLNGNRPPRGFGDENNEETVSVYACVDGCPVAKLDQQSGPGDRTARSHIFPTFVFEEDDFAPFLYCAKAARSEREAGCEGLPARTGASAVEREEGSAGLRSPREGAGRTAAEVSNHHPTVKPLGLLRWLVRLVTPPGGTVLDPFAGSGTAGVACVREGFGFVGIEREAEYVAIAEARVACAQRDREAP